MKRLLEYLVALAKSGFYGTVTIPFRGGQVVGKITVQQDFVMETLPSAVRGTHVGPTIVRQKAAP